MSTDAIEAYTKIEEINGVPYRDWTIWWWSWALQGPRERNPVFDTDGHNADNNQPTGYNVKFLAGTFDRQPSGFTRRIRSNDSTSLLTTIDNANHSQQEDDNVFNATTRTATVIGATGDVISDARGSLRIEKGSSSVEYTIGGSGGRIPERIQLDRMTFLSPGQGIVQSGQSGADLDFMYSAMDGWWVFLKPLAAGEYKFKIHGDAPWFGDKGAPRFTTDVTYEVTVDKT